MVKKIMVAAPRSGSGKTMITCGLLNLLCQKKLDIISFKCGPDYIDPLFHKKILGINGGNLDTFFCKPDTVANIVNSCGHEYAVIEGVMGLYDGIGGLSLEGSSYDVAKACNSNIVLVIDAYGTGRTIISHIKGILLDDVNHLIKAVILNKISRSFYEKLRPVIMEELEKSGFSVDIIGFIPKLKDISIDSRHLGLKLPDEIEDIHSSINKLSNAIEENCDIERLISLMSCDEVLNEQDVTCKTTVRKRVAIAMDEAFCFYYRENLELLKGMGIELVPFSPIHDSKLPDNISGLILGGGYPELYLSDLSNNKNMLEAVREVYEKDIVVLAECGGFMYLHESIKGDDGISYPMVGAIKGSCHNTGSLVRFGYVELNCEDNCLEINGMRGHEFHYYDSDNNGNAIRLSKPGSDIYWQGMHILNKKILGFPHLYYPSNKRFIENLF